MIHGVAASLHDWDDLIPELAKDGYASYALDLLGHGDSPKLDSRAYQMDWLFEHFSNWMKSLHLTRTRHSDRTFAGRIYCAGIRAARLCLDARPGPGQSALFAATVASPPAANVSPSAPERFHCRAGLPGGFPHDR